MKKSNKSVQRASEHKARNKIQGVAGAASGGLGGVSHIVSGGYADGYHRVPNVNANSDGDFNWNLGNFEKVWDDNNAFLCLCNLYDFSRYLLAGVLSARLFFQPPSMRPTSSRRRISAP